MDSGRFDRLARVFSVRQPFSRRGMGGIAAGAAASLALARDAEGKKGKKKKCKKKKCEGVCPDGADTCADEETWGCGLECVCRTGATRTICAELNLEECIPCEVDEDCDELTGQGSVCQAEVGGCSCDGQERVCVAPCANPLPTKSS